MYFGRGKNKISNPYTTIDFYEDYKIRIEADSPYDIDFALYREIVSLYNKKITDKMMEGYIISLPYKLGSIQIVKKKMYYKTQLKKRLGINWEATVKYGKIIHHINEHSDGYKYLFHWNKRKGGNVKNIFSYKYIPTRTLKRLLAKNIKELNKDYFEVK